MVRVGLFAIGCALLSGCSGGGGGDVVPGPTDPPGPGGGGVPTLSIVPAPGAYDGGVAVRFNSSESVTKILFTLNGADPVSQGTPFTSAIQISESKTVRAVAFDGEGRASPEISASYEIRAQPAPKGPIVNSDEAATAFQGDTLIRVLANDQKGASAIKPSTLELVRPSANGAVVSAAADGTVLYQSPVGFSGVDTFSYRVADTDGNFSAESIVYVNVLTAFQHPISQGTTADGLVVIEAELFDRSTARDGARWVREIDPNATNGAILLAHPNVGAQFLEGFSSSSPQIDYQVNFARAGKYYVWVRGVAPSGDDDSVHIGLDGAEIASSDAISYFDTSLSWTNRTMDGPIATLNVATPGLKRLNLWVREDGAIVDRILLTTSETYRPTGAGPNQSERREVRDGSFLSIAADSLSGPVDLSQDGTTDWTHWGFSDSVLINRKADVAPQISDVIALGTRRPIRINSGGLGFSWRDGAPQKNVAESKAALVMPGLANGFQLSVKAGTGDRTLRLYVGAWQSLGRIEAFLNDGSASSVSVEIPSETSTTDKVVSISYRAATADARLDVKFYLADDYGTAGNLKIYAASLVDEAGMASVSAPTISPPGGTFANSIDVSLATATPGSTIRYSTDGSDPAFGAVYNGPITLTATSILAVQAFVDGMSASAIIRERFNQGQCPPIRIMPLGDSITMGSGTPATEGDFVGYRRKLYRDLTSTGRAIDFVGGQDHGAGATDAAFDTQHEGHGGWRVEEIADNVYGWLSATPADVILLHIGTNNTAGPGVYTEMTGLDRLLSEIDRFSPDTRVVLAQIINERSPREEVRLFNDNFPSLLSVRNLNNDRVVLIDMEQVVAYPGDFADKLHPDIVGYQKMADKWRPAVESVMPVCQP